MALGDKLPVVMGREKAVPDGVATLGEDGKLAEAQRPTYTATDVGAVQDPETAGTAGQILGLDQEGKPEWRDPPATGVTSFNGRTGAVTPQAGDYNAAQIPVSGEPEAETVAASLASKAPAGYGLGTYGPDVSDLNEAVKSGFYSVAGTYQNGPVSAGEGYSPLLVISGSSGGRIAQLYYGDNYAYVGCIAARRYSNLQGTWSPWEWINPPMEPGVEYRTAEKYNKAPVYCQLVDCGALPPNGTTKSVQHGISSIDCVLRAYGTSPVGKFNIPYQANAEGVGVCANATTIYVESQNLEFEPTTYTAQVVIFYTKVE